MQLLPILASPMEIFWGGLNDSQKERNQAGEEQLQLRQKLQRSIAPSWTSRAKTSFYSSRVFWEEKAS